MSILANAFSRSGPDYRQRLFAGARNGPLFADWIAGATSGDAEIRSSYRRLLDRSRSLERDNDYVRGFLLSCQRNINGVHKFDLRSDAGEYVIQRDPKTRQSMRVWQPDLMAKSLIESAWEDWGKAKYCTLTRRQSWRAVRRLAVRALIRDGNVLIRKVRGSRAGNRYGFAIQLLEVDHLDLDRFQVAGGGRNEVRFGIEMDPHGAPVAYYIRTRHPGDDGAMYGAIGYSVERVPASEIMHVFLGERASQSIGFPWIVSAITRLRQLGLFEEAAVVAARIGASKAGFFKRGVGPDGMVGEWAGEHNADGNPVMEAAAGQFEALPVGWDLANWDPQYPNIETGDFRKAMLRGVCASLGVAYTTIGNDLESVNFSSARVGLFDEREGWKDLQLFFSEEIWERLFSEWIESALMEGAINLPVSKLAKFDRAIFKARRWAMIDPAREVNARATAIALRLGSRRGFIEEDGGDVEEVFHDNRDDENLADSIGLSLQPPDPQQQSVVAAVPEDNEEDEDEDDEDKSTRNKPKRR